MLSPYVRNAWYVAAWSHELEAEDPLIASILGEPIVIYRAESGRLVALEDRCVHRLAPLSLGRCEGERLRCMYHGLLYDPDGKVAEIPGQDLVPRAGAREALSRGGAAYPGSGCGWAIRGWPTRR